MEFIKKYRKIIFALSVVVILFSVYFIGQCNGKRSVKPNTTDTMAAYVNKINKDLAKKQYIIDSLERKHINDSLQYVVLLRNEYILGQQQAQTIEQIKFLPFDSAMTFAQRNYNDTTKILKIQMYDKNRACLSSSQLMETNICFSNNKFLLKLKDTLNKKILLLLGDNETNRKEVEIYKSMLIDKDNIVSTKDEQLAIANKDLAKETKMYRRQKFWKFVYKGGFLATLIYAALK